MGLEELTLLSTSFYTKNMLTYTLKWYFFLPTLEMKLGYVFAMEETLSVFQRYCFRIIMLLREAYLIS